jgi:hypothetical protein
MRGVFWNIRGLNQPGRNISLEHLIKSNRVDFVGVQKTKRKSFAPIFFLKISPTQLCLARISFLLLGLKGGLCWELEMMC